MPKNLADSAQTEVSFPLHIVGNLGGCLIGIHAMNVHARALIDRAPGVHADSPAVVRALNPRQPLFCFSPQALRAAAAGFRQGFPGEVSYAVKANGGPSVVAAMADAGIGVFDVASVAEMDVVAAAAPGARLHYHNPVKSRHEIAEAFAVHGCRRFALDDVGELAKILEVLAAVPDLELAVRFRLPSHGAAAHDFSTKFGADPQGAADLLRLVARAGHRPVLTFHPGSQCTDPKAYARYIEAAGEIARAAGVRLAALNVGGGFPATYRDSVAPPLSEFFAMIAASAAAAFGNGERPPLECEPGRGLVATSMSLLTRVKLVKPSRRELYLNDGIYGALMEMSQAPALAPHCRVLRGGVVHGGPVQRFTAYGPTCDPLDRIPGELTLPADIAEDDFIEFSTVGAYGAATATRFNGYGSAGMVIVEDGFVSSE
jgi:ornithine decarboxylase